MPESTEQAPEGALSPGVRRRRREAWLIIATAVAVVVFAIFQARLPQYAGTSSVGTDAILVALINLNLILLVLLVFLVGRNIAKLILDRRRRILGSHLRVRLVLAFVAIALLPATLLFLVAMVFVGNSVDDWFNSQVEGALEGSLEVARAYYQDVAGTSLGFARQTAARVAADDLLRPERREALKRFLDERRADYQLDLIEVFAAGRVVVRSRAPRLKGKVGLDPWAELVRRATAGEEATAVDTIGRADVIRAAAPVMADGRPIAAVVVDAYVPNSVVRRREEIDRSFGEYLRLKIQRRPIQTAYLITLSLVSLVVLFSATWVGFYVARGITVPIQRLAEGTRAVAQGDLEYRIEGEGDDEIGTLVTAFNRMTADLMMSRTELEARRRDLEIVLANITAGVVSADAEGRVTTMNGAAAALLGMSARACVGRSLAVVFAGGAFAEIRQLATELLEDEGVGRPAVERPLRLARGGLEIEVLLTGTLLVDEAGAARGIVLFLEDVTHLLQVQRMEAWRDVARRIAHEIKNPLTPIQLSAQRLRRRYAVQLREGGAVFDECTRTIIREVEGLKALVNEFQNFARLPRGEHVPHDLNCLVEETLVLFREGHRDVDFEFIAAADLPLLELDREGIKRAIMNVLSNAVAACAARTDRRADERQRVEVVTSHQAALGIVCLEVGDNGIGIRPEIRPRIFEPYFSTKADGTGLGLAIVSSIVTDHNGFIRVRDNVPRGSRFVLEFPVRRRAVQLAVQARREAWG
jgi:two-component system nitrogen regulation sensor histidine kinase NtrY